MLYQLKYRQDKKAAELLAAAAADFCIRTWKLKVDAIVPVPPSQPRRLQPVLAVATRLSQLLQIPFSHGLSKIKKNPQLKDLTDYDERAEALREAFEIDAGTIKGRRILLFDDLYGSGATVRTITRALINEGAAKTVHLLTLTKKASA